ncbi:hypothetical protein BDA96_03G405900 [Sorghum bicolor]|uniref:Uncharacterized protein n=1 Tax=Sorghum bicolor TaxID=4558 RepID=A0A921RHL6_SORBI|nr:hypothetical protein BDA96_03G405900 [Sorghum bicolor]
MGNAGFIHHTSRPGCGCRVLLLSNGYTACTSPIRRFRNTSVQRHVRTLTSAQQSMVADRSLHQVMSFNFDSTDERRRG